MEPTILVVDDEPAIREAHARMLQLENYQTVKAASGNKALERLEDTPIDLVVLDLDMDDGDGLSVLSAMRARGHKQPVVMVSGHGSIDAAVEATRLGAFDFLTKPVERGRLFVTVSNALDMARLVQKQAESERGGAQDELLGSSKTMTRLRDLIDRAAPTEGRVLITGDNGTGKELVARNLHNKSRRAGGPFVKLNCAAVPTELVESELFGHEKGAFTGAVRAHRGRFELADGGTLFLDEIGDMPLAAQAKILRVLQEREFERVGGSKTIRVSVRILAATNQDLAARIEQGAFRLDLFHRLNVIPIRVPALRERREDIAELARSFVASAAARNDRPGVTISDGALSRLAQQEYPGNVRELQNVVERLVILAPSPAIDTDDVDTVFGLAASPTEPPATAYRDGASYSELMADAQRMIVGTSLRKHDYHVANTAKALGLGRAHLYKKCHALGLMAEVKSAGK